MNTYLVTFVVCGFGEMTKILEEPSMTKAVKTLEDNFGDDNIFEIKQLIKIK